MAEVAYGLCLAIAQNSRATLLRGTELVTPIVLVGGGALNPGLVRAFQEVFDFSESDLIQVDHPPFCAAQGVAIAARERSTAATRPEVLGHLSSQSGRAFRASARVLRPIRGSAPPRRRSRSPRRKARSAPI